MAGACSNTQSTLVKQNIGKCSGSRSSILYTFSGQGNI